MADLSHSHNTELRCAVLYHVPIYGLGTVLLQFTYPVLHTRHSPLLIPDYKFEDCVLVIHSPSPHPS